MRPGAAVVLLVLATPLALAATVGGELLVEGPVGLPPGSRAEGSPLAIFVEDASAMGGIAANASAIRVRLFEDSYLNADIIGPRTTLVVATNRPTWTARDATILVEAARPGWFGIHPDEAVLSSVPESRLEITAAAQARLGNGDAVPDRNDPSRRYYLAEIDHPSILTSASTWSYEGGGAIKAMGPRVKIVTPQNTTTFDTGDMADPDNPGRFIQRWIVIESDAMSVEADAAAQIAAERVNVAWNGAATVNAAHGSLAGTIKTWTADGGPSEIDGDLEATLEPAGVGSSLVMRITGDLRSSTMATRVSAPIPEGPGVRIGIIFLIGAVLASAGTIAIAHRRRRRNASILSLGADEYMSLAERAADGEHFEEALKWVRLAREHSPTSRRLALDEAFYSSMSGDRDTALQLLREPILADDADACLLRARLQLESGDLEDAARAVIHALELAPIILLDVETDPNYHEILLREDVKRAVRQARRKLT